MTYRLNIIVLLLIALSTPGIAQQYFQFSQYQQTPAFYNPAFSGIEDFADIKIGYRKRWAGFNDSPSSAFVMANLAFEMSGNHKYKRRGIRLVEPEAFHRMETDTEFQYRKARRNGIGFGIVQNDNTNVTDLGGFLSYAYHIAITDYIIWSVGASSAVSNKKLDPANLTVTDPTNDITFQDYTTDGGSTTDLSINVGTVLYAKRWYIGYAANRVAMTNLKNVNNFSDTGNRMLHNFMIGVTINKPKYAFHVLPAAMVEYTQNNPLTYTLALRVRYEDAIWGGIAYRSDDAASMSMGMYLTQNIAFNYAFEYPISAITGLSSSTHELILAIKLNNKNYSRAYMW